MKESFIISMLFIIIFVLYLSQKKNVVKVESDYDGNKYYVYDDNMKLESAKLLSQVVERMFRLKDILYKTKADYPEYEKYVDQLNRNFDKQRTKIYENGPDSDLTSYSINKGEEMAVCLRSKKNGQLHQINLLMYVTIHEMAHIACPETGHTQLFKDIFAHFIRVAISNNIYSNENYAANPVEYCGMKLSSSIV
jgi:hypothetical protein